MEQSEKEQTNAKNAASKFLRGGALLLVGRVFAIVIKFAVQLMFIRYLPKEQFGAFAYVISIVDMSQILVLIALDKTASRFIPIYSENDDKKSILGFLLISVWTVLTLSAIILLFVFTRGDFIVSTLISDHISYVLLLFVITLVPAQALDSLFQGVFAAFGDVRSIFFRRYVLWPILQFVVILFIVLLQFDVFLLAIGYALSGVLTTATYAFMLVGLMRREGLVENFSLRNGIKFKFGEIYGFTLPMFLTGIVLIVRSQFIIIFMEFFNGVVAVAEYRAVEPVLRLITIVYDSFVYLYLPMVSRLFASSDDEGVDELYWRATAWMAIITFPVFLVTFSLSDSVVALLFPDEYSSSSLIMAVMAIGAYVDVVAGFNKDTLRAYNRIKYLMFVDILIMFIALISIFLFVPSLGALGGGIAYVVVIIFNNVLYHIGLVRFTSVRLFDFSYLSIYLTIIISAIALKLIQTYFALPLFITLPIVALISILILRANVMKLKVGETFPELLKVPILNKLLKV